MTQNEEMTEREAREQRLRGMAAAIAVNASMASSRTTNYWLRSAPTKSRV